MRRYVRVFVAVFGILFAVFVALQLRKRTPEIASVSFKASAFRVPPKNRALTNWIC